MFGARAATAYVQSTGDRSPWIQNNQSIAIFMKYKGINQTAVSLVRPTGVIDNFRGAGVRRVRFSGDCP
jgi:hypothetical protein